REYGSRSPESQTLACERHLRLAERSPSASCIRADRVAYVNPDLELALRLADAADAISFPQFGSGLAIETKPDLTPVTEADRTVEAELRRLLAAERPDDAVLGEEGGAAGSASRRWIVDPIDGTRNYARGIPVWATLIALESDGLVSVGVVSAPALASR